jgi:hypothetical protein
MSHDAGTRQLVVMSFHSDDPQAVGVVTNFSHPIHAFTVDDAQNYEVALVSVDYPSPGGTDSVYVGCSMVGVTRSGSQLSNTLYRLPPAPAATNAHHLVQQSIVPWRPLASNAFNVVEVALTNDSGVPIPQPVGSRVILTIAIRRV